MKKQSVDMTEGSILKHLIVFAVPLIFSNLVQKFYSTADMAVLSRFVSQEAFAAVGACTSAVNLIINIVIGFSAAGGVVVSKCFGAKDNNGLSNAVHTNMFIAIVSGVVLSLCGIIITPMLLNGMNCPKDLLNMSALYLRIYFTGLPFLFFASFFSTILRALGDSKKTTKIYLISGALNVLLNIVFVVLLKMAIAGVAVATVISQIYSAVSMYLLVSKTDEAHKFSFKKLRIYKGVMKDVMLLAVPTSLQQIAASVSAILIQSSINSVGTVAMAANAASINLENYAYVVMNSMFYSMVTFLGQNYGAKNYKRMKRGYCVAVSGTCILGLTVGSLMCGFSDKLLLIFGSDSEMIHNASMRMFVMIGFYFISSIADIGVAGLRTMGKSIFPSIITITGLCGVISLVAVLCGPYNTWNDLMRIYWTYPIVWTVMAVTFGAMFFAIIKKRKMTTVIKKEAVCHGKKNSDGYTCPC